MPNWFYTDANGLKQGPINEQQFVALAAKGIITRETVVENERGKSAPAGRVKGLMFAETKQPETEIYDFASLPLSSFADPNSVFDALPAEHTPFAVPVPVARRQIDELPIGRKPLAENTKLCQYCKSEIDAAATVCPHCTKTQNQGAACLGCLVLLCLVIGGCVLIDAVNRVQKRNMPAYTIVSDTNLSTIKRHVAVRIEKRMTEEQLEKIAIDIKNKNKHLTVFERTFIDVLLPEMVPGSREIVCSAWATTHFNPDLKVIIQGTPKEFAEAMLQKTQNDSAVIGAWGDYSGDKVFVIKKSGNSYMAEQYSPSTGSAKPVLEGPMKKIKNEKGVEVFVMSEPANYHVVEDQYRIDQKGNLLLYNRRDGPLLRLYEKLE